MRPSVRLLIVIATGLLLLADFWLSLKLLLDDDPWGLLVMLVPTIVLLVLVARREQRFARIAAELCAPVDPAITSLPAMKTLMKVEEARARLRGLVREIRTYSNPTFRGSVEYGGIEPMYCSVLIDTHGEVHDLEESSSFSRIEGRAQTLAQLLRVPFASGI